ncbi:hypothetical protein [Clostridium frigidicarnis]|uniref:Glycosyl hydrolases family 32 N-terminal domain-containing protein n=1 Tax=Clostridium frigidicarnis TaxID=84698 RepID=A0A1I0X7H2_9CLOT|nr:hypothetical protein [Clostridium frigidicarnis]SFA96992.1 Glycosyl hydrolases family 32 N-terminal domain-containing protein [Clostridium frigidicarnis]
MKWTKKGLIYGPNGESKYADNSALTPTPILINEDTIRVYSSFRDKEGVGRIFYVDLDSKNPSKIKKVSKKPILNIGKQGAFDDNGVILGDILSVNEKLYMYYVGFQKVKGVKFLAYTGLAISEDNGESFKRYSNAPVLDRSNEELYIRSLHTVIHMNGKWKAWGGIGNGWEVIDGIPYPQYDTRYYESDDGVNFSKEGLVCVECRDKEYRIGRPRVFLEKGKYHMFYTYGTTDRKYLSGYAISDDGLSWNRKDEEAGFELSKSGWDSKEFAYPAPIKVGDKIYIFYNGNDFGKEGFGYAELIDEL